MKLFLFTEGFPYGTTERPFITPELGELSKKYDVEIIAFTNRKIVTTASDIATVPENVTYSWLDTGFSGYGINSLIRIVAYVMVTMFDFRFWSELFRLICNRRVSVNSLWDVLFFDLCANRYAHLLEEKIGNKVDDSIIYTFWNSTFTLSALKLKKKHKTVKVVSRIHRYDLYEEFTSSGKWQPFKNDIDKEIDAIFFICKQGLDYYKAHFAHSGNERKYHLCYMGVEPKKNRTAQSIGDTLNIISCSSLIPRKRVDAIIRALSVLPDNVKISWKHFGDGLQRDELIKLASDMLDGKDNITYSFMGFAANSDVMKYYEENAVDCFILTSESEGLPVAIMEALSYGVPVIATNVGGIEEEIDGNGFILPELASNIEIAESIKQMYELKTNKPNAYAYMRKRSYELWKEKFDSKNNVDYLIDCLSICGE